MMKRIMTIAAALTLILACAGWAAADAEPLSRNELNAWREQLLKDSLQDNRYAAEALDGGLYSLAFDWYTLTADTQRVSSATRISGVTFELVPEEDEQTPADIRGLRPGDSVFHHQTFLRRNAQIFRRFQKHLRVRLRPGDIRAVRDGVEPVLKTDPLQDVFRVFAGGAHRQLITPTAQLGQR